MSQNLFSGVLAFPVTPMDSTGKSLKLDVFGSLLEGLINGGVSSIIPLGSTGEFAYLSLDERKRVAQASVEVCKGRVPAIIGTSAITTDDAIELAKHAQSIGADGVMVSIPTYYGLNAQEVRKHMESIAGQVDLPVMLYNNPFTSSLDLTVELIEQLAGISNLVAVKEATMDVNRISLLKTHFGQRFDILGGGFDPYAFSALCLGATGWTTGLANLFPGKCAALYEAVAVKRDLDAGYKLHLELFEVANLLVELGLTKAVKAGLNIFGLDVGVGRAPLGSLTAEDHARLERALAKISSLR